MDGDPASTDLAAADLVVAELTHRFCNSLQVLDVAFRQATVNMPVSLAAQVDLDILRERIQALARFNRNLSIGENGGITDDRLRGICLDMLRASGREDVTLRMEIDEVDLPEPRAGRIVLLLAELFLNALKHGGADGLTISVSLRRPGEDALLLAVANSCSTPPASSRLTPRIVGVLTQSLGGRLETAVDGDVEVRVLLPAASPPTRSADVSG